MVATKSTGSVIFEIFNVKIRIREVVALFLVWSVLLNVFLVSKLQTVEHGHSLHAVNSKSVNFRPDRNIDLSNHKPIRTQNNDGSGLRCESFGGPSDEVAADVVYWRTDIPKRKQLHSTYEKKQSGTDKYFIYEPDEAGFSNVRITFETVVALTKAAGRILVLSPKMIFHQLDHAHPEGRRSYEYTDFLDISNIPVISMEDYLGRVAMSGQLHNLKGEVSFPPKNRTNWNSLNGDTNESPELFTWLSESMQSIDWNRDKCIIPFPSENDNGIAIMNESMGNILKEEDSFNKRKQRYQGNPIPVNSSMTDRLREMLADRRQFCPYNETYQDAPSIYMDSHENTGVRPLIQFFAYLFFESWEQDLQMKRFIRDHLRFADIIQCAAARIVEGIREIARKVDADNGNINGSFDTMHIRRGDFKGLVGYKEGIVDPNEMISSQYFEPKRTVYIATDESDKAFFEPLRQHHTVLFLQDFHHLMKDIDPNYYGMIEQLVCAKGEKFVGTYYSTFSAYINRLRGYHAQKGRTTDALKGSLNSEYMGHNGNVRNVMKSYMSIQDQFWSREWPSAWRDIDFDAR